MEDVVRVPLKPGTPVDNDDVVVGEEVVVLLAANSKRKSALIVNVGEAPMRVTTDGSDPTATHGKPVAPHGTLTLSSPYCPTGDVKAIREGSSDTSANASEVS